MDNAKIYDGNLNSDYIVQKSNPLLLMKTMPFNLGELKILDVYLSRINSHNPDCLSVTFTKTEYEELMGLSQTRIATLKKYTSSMLQKIVEIPFSENEFIQINLFSLAHYKKNQYGEWKITLECSIQAKKYIFNIEKIGYIKYYLKNTIVLKSKYSFLLYNYLLNNRFRSPLIVPIDKLRQDVFYCESDYYKQFKFFKPEILDKSLKEINKLTDINFEYTTEKRGRTITAIHFIYINEKNKEQTDNIVKSDEEKEKGYKKHLRFIAGACNYEFSNDEMQQIFLELSDFIRKVDSKDGYDFVRKCYNNLNLTAKHKQEQKTSKNEPIKYRFNYFIKMLKAQIKETANFFNE